MCSKENKIDFDNQIP